MNRRLSDGSPWHPMAVQRAGALLATRLGLVALAAVTTWLIVWAVSSDGSFRPTPLLSALGLLPVNLVCLCLTSRALRADGHDLRSLFVPRAGWLRDIGWGLVWVAVLYLPFAITVFLTMLALHGGQALAAFETVFYDPDASAVTSPIWSLILGVLTFLTFAPLNAPTEEALYRGYAQAHLSKTWPAPAAILVCSLVFGAQHAFFAPTTDAMVVYVVAFTIWGIGSGVIVRRQGRLLPITIAHFVVNLVTSAGAVVAPILQLTGVIPTDPAGMS